MPDPYKQPFKVVVASLGDFGGIDMDVVDGEHSLAGELIEIEIQGSGVFSQLCLGFFEGDENARLGIHARAVDQEFDAEHGFTASRATTNESRASARKSAEGYFIEAGDSGRRFLQTIQRLV